MCRQGFEVSQKLTDKPVQHCPRCGAAVKKIITTVHVHTGLTSNTGNTLSNKNIAKHGFTQYRKVAPGQYEKTVGKQGPERLSTNDIELN